MNGELEFGTGVVGIEWAHPIVQEWFAGRFGTPTEPQIAGWPSIVERKATLIAAPTGSGKTLAAFLVCIDALVRKALRGELRDCVEVVYVSPLKALGNDIQKNLEVPLGEILQLAGQRGFLMPTIRTAVRTGDTLARDRRAMLARPPQILVTTPESLYILLTAAKSREVLRTVETVIVDEIHAMADDKRGSHLAVSLERLEQLAGRPLARIGLSATQKPIELVAQFLTGSGRARPVIVDVGHRREMDLAVEVPRSEIGAVATNEMWGEVYDRIAALALSHKSTLIFVNTRKLAEKVAHNLGERLGQDNVAAHHGSLSRKLRLAAEKKLKEGQIRALVATASLELGIDVGSVDLVCQIGSPRAIAVGLQRVGRAGHWRGAIPKGRIFATTRDELLECAALVRAIRRGELDRLEIPDSPMDILAQQIVAMCSAEDWSEQELFERLRQSYPYRDLEREDFEKIVEMLSEGITARRGRYGAYLRRDRVNGMLRPRRGARLAAITSGGAIPENALYTVVAEPEGITVGTLHEDFAVESMAGDIFLLGNTSWRVRRVSSAGRVEVEDAQGAPPSVPFWLGEAPARTAELSAAVAELREAISSRVGGAEVGANRDTSEEVAAAVEWLQAECCVDDAAAEQLVEYIIAGRAVLRAVPTQTTIVAERFFDEGGGMQLVIHAPFGGRINKAWGLALRKRFCRSFNFELQAAATDNGLNISLAEQHSFPLGDVFHFLHPNSVREVLSQAVLDSPLFATRWKWDAGRALALLRFQGGKKVPPQIQRIRADDLLASVFPEASACPENIVGEIKIPKHPLVDEVMKDVLTEAMDIDGLERILRDIGEGRIQCLAVDTPIPSQFSHEILNANPYAFLDDAPLEERRARAVEMRRMLPEAVLSEVGRLDPAAIEEVCVDAWPDVRDEEELHDALLSLFCLPLASGVERGEGNLSVRCRVSAANWRAAFERLASQRRVAVASVGDEKYWVTAEQAAAFEQIFPSACFEASLPTIPLAVDKSRDDLLLDMTTGWMLHSGPVTVRELAGATGIPAKDLDRAMLRLEAGGSVLRGQFTGALSEEPEWCDRRLLARIHRLTLGRLRKQVESVNAAQFMRWLLRWQHVAPGSQAVGEHGAFEVMQQLQGFEAPANCWERHILARRIADYDSNRLDQLCLTGAVGWGRVSPHPATLGTATIDDLTAERRRIAPTSVAPIAFFVREEADWMIPRRAEGEDECRGLSEDAAAVLSFLKRRGASFFTDIIRGTGKSKEQAEGALWELVGAGVLTADGFDNLRVLIDPKRRSEASGGRNAAPRNTGGRWSLLYPGEMVERSKALEATCWMLLRRYGIVFRELLARETIVPKWREVLLTLRRLEDRGEIRGGRFVSGFLGEQFALPLAVESLRATRNLAPAHEIVTVSAADPLNLVGIVVPGDRVAANSGRTVAFCDGKTVPPSEYPDVAVLAAG
jgi:ATP-dependent helicase Lhr and Lhr-like helicase